MKRALVALFALCACAAQQPHIQPRRALAAATLDGRVYITGGWNGAATQLDTVEIFDGSRVTPGPSLHIARSQHALVAADGALYAIGGWRADGGLVRDIERLDRNGTWRFSGPLPTPRREPAAALLGHEIVVAGGFDGMHDGDLDGYSDHVEALDVRTGRWRTLARLNVPRRGLALVVADGRLIALGGYNPADHTHGGFIAQAEAYDAATDRWVLLPWALAPRTWLAAGVLDGALVIAGGHDARGPQALVERVRLSDGARCIARPLAAPRAWLSIAERGGTLLALGGESPHSFVTHIEPISPVCQSQ
jgi:hypothetical protein